PRHGRPPQPSAAPPHGWRMFAPTTRTNTTPQKTPTCRARTSPISDLASVTRREAGQHLGAVKLDRSFLILLAGVNIHDRRAAIEQLLYRLDVNGGIGADRPSTDNLLDGNLRLRPVLNRHRIGHP